MDIVPDIRAGASDYRDVVLTVGSFDGIHRGHRLIIDRVTAIARDRRGIPAVLTMKPHPREFFSPENAPNLLTSDGKKAQLLEEAGIQVLFILPFDRRTADMEPERFIEELLRQNCHARTIVVGHDCRFGKGARGDVTMLRALGEKYGYTVEEVPPLIIGAERVSSTLVRERVLQGDLAAVQALLGRTYSLTGIVVRGRGIGVTLGFPTANVRPHHSAVPAQGVYIAEALVDGVRHPAAVNIGIAPTIRQEDLTVEAHLLDFTGNLVDKDIEIFFLQRLRSEKKFKSREELQEQIARDIESTRAHFRR